MSSESLDTTHIDDNGLWIPPEFRAAAPQIVFRTPRATIQQFPGDYERSAYCAIIDETHFGDLDDDDLYNPELAPNRVSIKPQGEDAVELVVSAGGD